MDAQNDKDVMNILYIDDDTDLIDIYTRFFEDSDYNLTTATSAEEGFEKALEVVPDLIISDVLLPGMTGVDLCRKIRSENRLCDTIVMLVTGMEAESSDIVDGFSAGADEYLLKPFSKEELFARLHALLRIKRLRDQVIFLENREVGTGEDAENLEKELAEARILLAREKELVSSTLKQMTVMVEEREDRVKEIKCLEEVLERDRRAMVSVFSQLIESKPQYHRGHCLNVAEISSSLGRMMSLSDGEISDIHAAGLLHELGKLAFPEELSMKKPADYSQAEADMVVLHPVKAWDMLNAFSGMEKIAKIVRHIHERMDGQGHPDGLKKDRIPVGARIIALVSAYDNLVYRQGGLSPEKAIDILDQDTGTRYDARVMTFLRRYAGRHEVSEEKKSVEVRLFEVKPGMTLAAGLYTVKGTKLLPENTTLTQDTINQIARYNKIDLLDETIFIKE